MEQQLQIVQLCIGHLRPEDVCMLRCTCSAMRDMRVSWHDHSIRFELDGSFSSVSWLHKNIVSMRKLYLTLSVGMPGNMLQDLWDVGR
jgi:hypothetical protein